MPTTPICELDPLRDLVLERVIEVPPELVWRAWTRPEHLKKWFTPKPWTIAACEVDLRPSGKFRVAMRGPEGEESNVNGCYLEVIENERLVWTDALEAGFRPTEKPFITAIITFEACSQGTKQTAHVLHKDAETRARHEEMGFYDGWGTCVDQLSELLKGW